MSCTPPDRHHNPTTTTALAPARIAGAPAAILRPRVTAPVWRRPVRPSTRGSLHHVDTFLAVVSRREVRDYDGRPLAEDAVRRILEAGRLAGSSRNRQSRRFIAITDRALIERLAEHVYTPPNLLGAALVVAFVTRGTGPTGLDAGRAAQNMLLVAWSEAIGSCPNGITDADACR